MCVRHAHIRTYESARIIRHECRRSTKRKLGSSTQRWTCFLMGSSARINILGGLVRHAHVCSWTGPMFPSDSLLFPPLSLVSLYLIPSFSVLEAPSLPSSGWNVDEPNTWRSKLHQLRIISLSTSDIFFRLALSNDTYRFRDGIGYVFIQNSKEPGISYIYIHMSYREKSCNGTERFPSFEHGSWTDSSWYGSTGNSRSSKS